MNKWIIGVLVVVAAAIIGVVALILRPAPAPPSTGVPAEGTATVTIQNSGFSPSKITVKKGTTVTWKNQDATNHNVVSDSDAPIGGPPIEAELFGKGMSFSFTYNTVGTFGYHCAPHPFMTGTVEVVE